MTWGIQEYYQKKRERLVDRKPNERSVAMYVCMYVCMCFGQVKHKVAVWYKEHIKIFHPSWSLKCTSEWLSMQHASLSVTW